MNTIKLLVAFVSRKTSSINRTVRYTWKDGKCIGNEPSQGAEWEIVELMNLEEPEPPIQVANVTGSAVLLGNIEHKIMINDPALFGMFKAGDIVELRVVPNTDTRIHCPKCGAIANLHYIAGRCLGCDMCRTKPEEDPQVGSGG